jgi:ABC-type sugar transport system ATPase subunit
MTVYANLAFPLHMRGMPRAQVQRRVGEVVETLGLADLLDRKPAALSGGQRQRVALGRALVREPAAFLFDEPLSSLDAGLRQALREEIKALHQKLHITTLYVTHDQSEAMALGDRLCVFRDGQIQQVGPPAEVYDRPANRFVAGFFGAPPMNFLTGRIRFEKGACLLDWAVVGFCPRPGRRHGETVQAGVRPHDLSGAVGIRRRLCAAGLTCWSFGSRTDVHVVLASGEMHGLRVAVIQPGVDP